MVGEHRITSGDRVIVKGLQWVRPGVEVKPVPANATQAPAVALPPRS